MTDQPLSVDTAAEEIYDIMQRDGQPQASQSEPDRQELSKPVLDEGTNLNDGVDRISEVLQRGSQARQERPVLSEPVLLDEGTNLNDGADRISEINLAAAEQKKAAAKKKFFDGIAGDQASEAPAPAKIKTPQTANEFDVAQREIDVQVSQFQSNFQQIDWVALAKSDPDRWRLEKAESERQHIALQSYQQQLNEARSLHQQGQQLALSHQQQLWVQNRNAQVERINPDLANPSEVERLSVYLRDVKEMSDAEVANAYQTWDAAKVTEVNRKRKAYENRRQQQVGKKLKVTGAATTGGKRAAEKKRAQANMKKRNIRNPHSINAAAELISQMRSIL